MLETSIFSISHNVFKRLIYQGRLKSGLCGKGLTHFQTTNFRLFQIERVCRLQFDENSRKLSKRVENTVGRGEIARYEPFLLSPQCFQKSCFPGVSEGVILWEWVKQFPSDQIALIQHFRSYGSLVFQRCLR